MSQVLDSKQEAIAREISEELTKQSKSDQEEIFEIARDLFTPAELSLLFGWRTEVKE